MGQMKAVSLNSADGGNGKAVNTELETSAAKPWHYSSAIKIFHLENSHPAPLAGIPLLPMHREALIAGYLCQAARSLLNVSQAWLWQRAKVSRKTINDFENGFSQPKPALIHRIRSALEERGAQFVFGKSVVGVVVYQTNEMESERSRSTKRRG
jgi:DNA-binding XRE family transcriptional regulator